MPGINCPAVDDIVATMRARNYRVFDNPDGHDLNLVGIRNAKEMTFTGRPLKGFVYVDPEGFESDEDLRQWVRRSLKFVLSLPPKT